MTVGINPAFGASPRLSPQAVSAASGAIVEVAGIKPAPEWF
jgi:hypothetical protein